MSESGGHSTGAPGGFTQSSNPFAGLTNTDLRPGRRRSKRKLLLDTSWITRQQTKERAMRKDVTSLVSTLYDSVTGIVASGAIDTPDRLTKSFEEFHATLEQSLEEEFGAGPVVLAKGLNHISAFADVLEKVQTTIEGIAAGYPILTDDPQQPPEPVLASTQEALERFLDHGVVLLKQLVNETAQVPDSEEDLERAELAGELVKVEGAFGSEMLVKSELPEEFAQYLADPLDVMAEMAQLGSTMVDDARDIADALFKADPQSIPAELAKAFPLVFDDGSGLSKLRPPQFGGQQAAAADETDEGDDPSPDDEAAGDIGDDAPQNPVQTILRLASIIVVIAGSLQQAMPGQEDNAAPANESGGADDARNVGLQRSENILDEPLAKLLSNEAEINVPGLSQLTLAEAVEKLGMLVKQVPNLEKALGERDEALAKLKQRFDAIASEPVRSPGMAKAVPVSKGQDINPNAVTIENDGEQVEKLQKNDPEGGAAAKFMIGRVHQTGGSPLVPPSGLG